MIISSNIKNRIDINNGSLVGAIVVTYQPNLSVLRITMQSLIRQVSHIYLLDNTQGGAFDVIETVLTELNCSNMVTTVIYKENLGIASAQNEGIRLAITHKCDFVILSDQDTCFPPDCIKILLDGFAALQQESLKVAALAPAFVNTHSPELRLYFTTLKGFSADRIFADSGLVEVKQVIASGQLMPSTVFSEVGFMDEQLFIDWVDIEWCWRARAKGWKIYNCADVVIRHTLGDDVKLLAGRTYGLRSPVRHYYIVRNALILALYRPVIPWKQRVYAFYRALRMLIGAPLFSRPHFTHLQYTLLGFAHGIINRHGKF